jgi:hypothetical protein
MLALHQLTAAGTRQRVRGADRDRLAPEVGVMKRTPSSGTTVINVRARGPAKLTVVSLHPGSPSRRTDTS